MAEKAGVQETKHDPNDEAAKGIKVSIPHCFSELFVGW